MKVKLFANLRQAAGASQIEIPVSPQATVGDLLEGLITTCPALEKQIFDKQRQVRQFVAVFVDGRDIRHSTGLSTSLDQAQEVRIFPPVAGGDGD